MTIDPARDWLYDPTQSSCPCGEEDCEHAFHGYFECACGEHHRPPVATSGRCPIDVEAETSHLVEEIEETTGFVVTSAQRLALRHNAANTSIIGN